MTQDPRDLRTALRRALKALEPFAREVAGYNWGAPKFTTPNCSELMWPDDFVPVLTGAECCNECGHSNDDSERAAFTIGDLRRARELVADLEELLKPGEEE